MGSTNQELLETLYQAFEARDAITMASCYHGQARFSDPVFTGLEGPEIGAMWSMLLHQGKDLVVQATEITADETSGSAHWEARYSFGPRRRLVHNVIEARFRFQDGKIIEHIDEFDLYRWAKMAMGPVGRLMGWNAAFRWALRRASRRMLSAYMRRHPPL